MFNVLHIPKAVCALTPHPPHSKTLARDAVPRPYQVHGPNACAKAKRGSRAGVDSTQSSWYQPAMSAMLESSEAAILNRVFRPDAADWPPEAAEALLEIRFNPQDRQRMTRLLRKAKSGTLTPAETEVLDNYRHVGRLLELMKARARRSLRLKRAA